MEISSSTLFHSEAARGEHFHSDFFLIQCAMPYALCERNNETLHLEKCKYLMRVGSNSSCNVKNLNSVNESRGDVDIRKKSTRGFKRLIKSFLLLHITQFFYYSS